MNPSCPSRERLRDYATGHAAADDPSVAGHVEVCPLCQSSMQEIVESAGQLPPIDEPEPDVAPKDGFLRLLKQLGPEPERSTRSSPNVRSGASHSLPSVPGYFVLDEIGRGGMGVVYRARHNVLCRTVAIKMLPHGLYPTEEDRKQLRAEAEAIARLRHPNIVQLFEFGEIEDRPYLVLEHAEGGTLREWVAARARPPQEAARIVEVLAGAVQHAHSRSTLHGDLKPGNVLLASVEGTTPDHIRVENLKVSDFGLARRLDLPHPPANDVTGTPAYMAPEQVPDNEAEGGPSAHPTTDVYALGAILYELLTGRPPFTGPDWQTILLQVRHRQPVSPRQLVPGIPRDLEAVCAKCLEKAPSARYTSAAALAEDLRRFQDGRPTAARPLRLLGRAAKGARRKPLLAAAFAVVTVAVASSGIALVSLLVSTHRQWAMERQLLDQAEARLYASRISQADLLWRECNLRQAAAVLNDCPVARRGWEWYYLRALCDDGFLVLSAPPGHEIHSVATNGAHIAAVSGGTTGRGRLLLWTLEGRTSGDCETPHAALKSHAAFLFNGRIVTSGPVPEGHTGQGNSVVAVWHAEPRPGDAPVARLVREISVGPVHNLSDDGRWLVDDNPGGVAVWDLSTDAPPTELTKPVSPLADVAINSRGTVVVGAAGKSDVFVWQLPNRAPQSRWTAQSIRSLAVSQDGHEVAGREAGGRFRRRNSASGKPLHDETLFTRLVGSTQYSPNNRFVLVLRSDGVRVFDTSINQRSVLSGPRGEGSSEVTALGVRALRNGAATGESNGAVRLWELALGQPDGRDACVYRGHAGAVRCVAFEPSEQWMLSGGSDGRIRAWDLSRPQRFLPLPTHPNATAFGWSETGREVLTVAGNQVVRFDTLRGKQLQELTLPVAAPAVIALKGHQLATADATTVRLWSLPPDPATVAPSAHGQVACDHPVEHLDLAAGGQVVLAAGPRTPDNGFTVSAWSADAGHGLWATDEPARVVGLATSEDSKLASVVRVQGPPGVLRVSDGGPAVALEGTPEDCFRSAAFSPDGRRLAAVGDRAVRVWSIHEGRVEWSDILPVPAAGVAFSSDSTRLAIVLTGGDVHLREASGGQELLRLPGPSGVPFGKETPRHLVPSFSPDGQRLLTPSPIGPLVWEAPIGLTSTRAARASAILDRPRP